MTVVARSVRRIRSRIAGFFALLALADEGVRPVCVVAGVTAQDAHPCSRARGGRCVATIRAQFDALRAARRSRVSRGALVSADAVRAVADGLARYPGIPVVVDPVLAASGGDALADDATRRRAARRAVPARDAGHAEP